MTATEIGQAHIGHPGTVGPRARKAWKAFGRVELAPRETKPVRMRIELDGPRYRETATPGCRLEAGEHRILVGPSSAGPLLKAGVAP